VPPNEFIPFAETSGMIVPIDRWVIKQAFRDAAAWPGTSGKLREKIFEPFFTTKPIGQGTGQGLALARALIVDRHHGTIDCTSAPDKGTTFTIRLPITGPTNLNPTPPGTPRQPTLDRPEWPTTTANLSDAPGYE
jgi:hypothetical protein